MPEPRPYFLNLVQIRLPIGGWVSIFHRVSGAALSLAVPLVTIEVNVALRDTWMV